jgi:hypothetical protein
MLKASQTQTKEHSMSTLSTRIAGYRVVISPATPEQIASHRATSYEQGWHYVSDYSRAVTASFVPDVIDNKRTTFMDLPYELRSTVMLVQPERILDVMAQHIKELDERTSYESELHPADCHCESCAISQGMLMREFHITRGNFAPTGYPIRRYMFER